MTADSLQVRDLHKSYPTPAEPLVVLNGVSFTLSPGESASIVGPSGSGKSTLLNILGTIDTPTSGSVRFGSIDPHTLSANELATFRAQTIGFVFQDHHLLPQCTAMENVLVARLATGRATQPDVDRAHELLGRVGLANRSTHFPSELSGGERQRVAVARALMNKPSLLLCDEPTGSLDARTGAIIADLIFEIAAESKLMLITVTHSDELAARFPRKLRMDAGTLVEGNR